MRKLGKSAGLLLVLGGLLPVPAAEWVQFADETAVRFAADPGEAANDLDEKTYGWGDLDRDGDIDLVVVRKSPFSTTNGKRPNFLFLNENGVLTERTAEFATASDVAGDMGFATPTHDRDVKLVDVDLDGWLDVVTAASLSDGDPKHIGHPRVYMNLGCTGSCAGTADWLGLRYEDARIPAMRTYWGLAGYNPRFTTVSAGDVTGDGYPDLWFSDHDQAGSFPEPSDADFNDRLLVNQGTTNPGRFIDATDLLFGTLFVPGHGQVFFKISGYSPGAAIADLDGDGASDILKVNGTIPLYTGIAYNGPPAGVFAEYETVPSSSTYGVSAADLNRDDKIDILMTSDDVDRYLLNQGNNPAGLAQFSSYLVTYFHSGIGSPSSDQGFGGNNVAADLNRDGWPDLLVTDITEDIPGCARRLGIYRNLGGYPGGTIGLRQETTGAGCAGPQSPASCRVASIPSNLLTGTFDVAVFDINGDDWLDLVVGRCDGTRVFINQPPPAAGSVPDTGTGEMLLLGKDPLGRIEMSWGSSCLEPDTDYAIYGGSFPGPFTNHSPLTCTTQGLEEFLVAPLAGNNYYLVVAHNGSAEGSYGTDSAGNQRPQSVAACFQSNAAVCE